MILLCQAVIAGTGAYIHVCLSHVIQIALDTSETDYVITHQSGLEDMVKQCFFNRTHYQCAMCVCNI